MRTHQNLHTPSGKPILKYPVLLGIFLLVVLPLAAQQQLPEPWISYPTASVNDYGVYHFRKTFHLELIPGHLRVHISADNRYKLFVNGEMVGYGPAKGDLKTYKYDVVDLAPFLREGKNTIAALVYNAGKDKPMALLTVQTAFMMRPELTEYSDLYTDSSWKVLKNPAYEPVSYQEMLFKKRWFYGYYACGPGDDVDGSKYPWNWEMPDFDDTGWKQAEVLTFDDKPPWNLVERSIAFMDRFPEYPAKTRQVKNTSVPQGFTGGTRRINGGSQSFTVAPNTKAEVLLDFEILTMGYPELAVNGGAGSSIQVKYAEALYEKVNLKAHRDSVEEKTMFGVWDIFRPDGGSRVFIPLWKRCFRYVQLVIETGDEPLEVLSYHNEYSGYPYPEMSTFISDNDRLNTIFEMGLRTLRMCSGETYYDTPFYEQLSYGGDNRPIAALSTYNSTDDRLLREVMRLYPQSENRETNLFKSAYPSRFDFDMGSWSMAWIQSLYDYYLVRGDAEYVRQFTKKIEGVLGFYHRHMDESLDILGSVKNQNFIDWSITKGSIPRKNENGEMTHSTLLTLYYLHTLDCAIDLFNKTGQESRTVAWQEEAERIRKAVKTHCWNAAEQLFMDYPGKEIYSQHTNLFAILCDVIPEAEQKSLLEKILSYNDFEEYASSYFSFFLFKAMVKTGMEEAFLEHLDFWYNFIDMGHTTCGETGFASHDRSDCHAWAAHPSYYLLSIVAGINRGDIGFNTVRIEPHPGNLSSIKASMPHPNGRIEVEYLMKRKKLQAKIILPAEMEGEFIFQGQTTMLVPGENSFSMQIPIE